MARRRHGLYDRLTDFKIEKRFKTMNDNYFNEVKEKWGNTEAYAEFADKTKGYSKEHFEIINSGLDSIMGEFCECMNSSKEPNSEKAQKLVGKLQKYITDNLYTCTDDILNSLGQMYIADERFKTNIDKHGKGTAEYISKAILNYCNK